jgi:regulatory protein
MTKKQPNNPEVSWVRIRRYCDQAERCHQDVKKKLQAWEVPYADHSGIIARLIEEGYLNEFRYASAFAHDHHAFRQWGKRKIVQALKRKGLQDRLIMEAVAAIPDEREEELLFTLAKKKWETVSGTMLQRKGKVMRYLFNKGYESSDIHDVIHRFTERDE